MNPLPRSLLCFANTWNPWPPIDGNHRNSRWPSYADHLWAVTGTPLSSSYNDVKKAAMWLGHWSTGLQLGAMKLTPAHFFASFRDKLRKLMIRHTKSMQIGGADALSLPMLTSETIFLSMGVFERHLYNKVHSAVVSEKRVLEASRVGCSGLELGMALARLYQANCGNFNGITRYDMTLPNIAVSFPHSSHPTLPRTLLGCCPLW